MILTNHHILNIPHFWPSLLVYISVACVHWCNLDRPPTRRWLITLFAAMLPFQSCASSLVVWKEGQEIVHHGYQGTGSRSWETGLGRSEKFCHAWLFARVSLGITDATLSWFLDYMAPQEVKTPSCRSPCSHGGWPWNFGVVGKISFKIGLNRCSLIPTSQTGRLVLVVERQKCIPHIISLINLSIIYYQLSYHSDPPSQASSPPRAL